MPAKTRRPSRPLPGMAAYAPPLPARSRGTAGGRSRWEDELAARMRHVQMPTPVRELMFHPRRKWRFDFAWPAHMVAVEVDGAIWTQGRHTRGAGYSADILKANSAILLGWRVIHVTDRMITDGSALVVILRALRRFPASD